MKPVPTHHGNSKVAACRHTTRAGGTDGEPVHRHNSAPAANANQARPPGWRPPAGVASRGASLALIAGTLISGAWAEEQSTTEAWRLGELSIEQLMNESVTSVSKREQRLFDTAAAVTVLSNDDLHRSGATTTADALRLVPGVQVASIDSGTWAITARGFNSQFANKLLVMQDGRTVYLPLFSGVLWDAQQVFIEDLERIEVIRGPGATIWGANAVNGVISLVSKSARDTRGGLIYAGAGTVQLAQGGARYGAQVGDSTYYRVYGNYQLVDDSRMAGGRPGDDSWDLGKVGFRVDHYADPASQLTWQGDAYTGNIADRIGSQRGLNTLGRWTRHYSGRAGLEIQGYVDQFQRDDSLTEYRTDVADLSVQQTIGLGERHDVILGVGYRHTRSELRGANSPAVTILNDANGQSLFNAFLQDEIAAIHDRLTITLGTKVENNEFTGWEVQPSARAVFKPAERHALWTAVSRAVRTPSESERMPFISFVAGSPVSGPGGELYVPTFVSNTRLQSEDLLAFECGYRAQPLSRVTLDLALFYNDYNHLVGHQPAGFVPGTPVGLLEIAPFNSLTAESFGGEASAQLALTDTWRVSLSYSGLRLNAHGNPTSDAEQLERNAPTHQIVLRSSSDFCTQAGGDVQGRYVDNVDGVPAYFTADVRLWWRPVQGLEIAVVGQNLLDSQHPEQTSVIGLPSREVPRGVYGRLTWRF